MTRTLLYWGLCAAAMLVCLVGATMLGALFSWIGTLLGFGWPDNRFFIGFMTAAWFYQARPSIKRFAYDETDAPFLERKG